MAGQTHLLILAAVFGAAMPVWSADPAPAKQPDGGTPGPRKAGKQALSREFSDVRKAIDALTPEQRQRFTENFRRWVNLSTDERKALADREGFRRKKMGEDIDNALAEAGLDLDGERRAQFAKRYSQERRKIEEQLRAEMEQKRGPLVKELVGKLKTEFATSTPAPTATTPQ